VCGSILQIAKRRGLLKQIHGEGKGNVGTYIQETLLSCEMNGKHFRRPSWTDTRARFVDNTPAGGSLLDIGSSDGETLEHFCRTPA
jgi:hypothetical protein